MSRCLAPREAYELLLALALPVVIAAPELPAQGSLDVVPAAGVGRQTAVRNLGVLPGVPTSTVFLAPVGLFYVSDGTNVVRRHNTAGALVDTLTTPIPGPIDVQRMTTDGTRLICVDSTGAVWATDAALNPVNVVDAAAGPQTVTAPITTLSSISAIAFDPRGNGGLGSLLNNTSLGSIFESPLTGPPLPPVTGPELAHANVVDSSDPLETFLWMHAYPDPDALTQFRRSGTTLVPTGRTVPIRTGAGFAAGLTMVAGNVLEGRPFGQDLVGMNVGLTGEVTLTSYRLHHWDHYPAQKERTLLFRTDAGPWSPTMIDSGPGDVTLEIDLDVPGYLYIALINFEPQSLVWTPVAGPLTFIWPEFYEFRRLLPGFDFSGLSGAPITLSNALVRQFTPAPHAVRVQAIYLDFDLLNGAPAGYPNPLMTTNEGGWNLLP